MAWQGHIRHPLASGHPSEAWQGHIRPPLWLGKATSGPLCGLARPHQAPPPARKVCMGGRGRRGTPGDTKNSQIGLIGVAMEPFDVTTAAFCTELRPGCSQHSPGVISWTFSDLFSKYFFNNGFPPPFLVSSSSAPPPEAAPPPRRRPPGPRFGRFGLGSGRIRIPVFSGVAGWPRSPSCMPPRP